MTLNCISVNNGSPHHSPENNQNSENKVVIETDCGKVEGMKYEEITTDPQAKLDVYEFRNIPYAVPPIGNLRWRPPVRLSKDKKRCWNGTLQYDSKKIVACKQINPREATLKTTEDCLVLTVRTPSINPDKRLPVLYWIHGGGMDWGYNEMFAYHPDREFSASMQVVTVSVNYRLNIFGFLSLKELWITSGADESYGNYGVMDQVLGLQWVRDNIGNFGGDPNKVTIYGESGGGTGVYCLISSPLAKGLYQKASPASGAPHIRVTHVEADKIYRTYIEKSNCSFPNPSEVVDCLQNKNTEVLLNLWQGPTLNYHGEFPDKSPYTGHPIEILDPVTITQSPDGISLGTKDNIDFLIGNTAQEIGPFPNAPSPVANITTWEDLQNKLEPRINTFKEGLYPKVLELYTERSPEKVTPIDLTPAYIYEVMATDVLLICTTDDVVGHLKLIESFNVYRFIASQPATKEIGLGLNTAYHGWDTVALFGLKFFPSGKVLPHDDKEFMLNIRRIYWGFLHSSASFPAMYKNKVIDFWKNGIIVWEQDYHKKECKVWRKYGFLKYAWGNIGEKTKR